VASAVAPANCSPRKPSPTAAKRWAVIQRATDRATGIVQQLLRFARRSVEQQRSRRPRHGGAPTRCGCANRRRAGKGVAVERELRRGRRRHAATATACTRWS
jgi:hypothetical protein